MLAGPQIEIRDALHDLDLLDPGQESVAAKSFRPPPCVFLSLRSLPDISPCGS